MSSITNYRDRNTCVLFGDAAGAVLLEPTEEDDIGIIDFLLHSDGTGAEYLHMKAGGSKYPATVETVANDWHYIYQDGKTVFKFEDYTPPLSYQLYHRKRPFSSITASTAGAVSVGCEGVRISVPDEKTVAAGATTLPQLTSPLTSFLFLTKTGPPCTLGMQMNKEVEYDQR